MSCICHDGYIYGDGENIPCFLCDTSEYNDMFEKVIHVGAFLAFSLNNKIRIGVLIDYLPQYIVKIVYYEGLTKHSIEVKDSETIIVSREQFLYTYESKRLIKLSNKLRNTDNKDD